MSFPPIESVIPHRAPFLMIDRIVEVERRIVAARTFRLEEPFFQGHFPGNPIVPGVLLVEGLAQAMAYRAMLSRPAQKAFLVGIDRTRFHSAVLPGEEAIFEVTLPELGEAGSERFGLIKGHGLVRVGDRRIAEAQLSGYSGEPGRPLG